MSERPHIIRVLHVDDDPDFLDLTASVLEGEHDHFSVKTAPGASQGLEQFDPAEIDCLVSDYDMPEMNGIEFLEAIREDHPEIPFILFTGKGSEAVASKAISAGVSDYLRKKGTIDQYTILANRVTNLVRQHRAEKRVESYADREAESEQYRQTLLDIISDPNRTEGEKINRLLELGCDRFGVENGHLVMIDEEMGHHEVVSVHGSDVVQKSVTDLSKTYCRRTIRSDAILDVHHAGEQGWEDDTAYETFGLESYIGGKLIANGRLYGTLCFVDTQSRDPFTHNEKAFFDLLLRWFSHLLERRRRFKLSETLFEDIYDGLVLVSVVDESTFRVQRVNPSYEALTGCSNAELKGKRVHAIPGDDRTIETRCRTCVEDRQPVEYTEWLTRGGETRLLQTRLLPLVEDGQVVQLVCVVREVGKRKTTTDISATGAGIKDRTQ